MHSHTHEREKEKHRQHRRTIPSSGHADRVYQLKIENRYTNSSICYVLPKQSMGTGPKRRTPSPKSFRTSISKVKVVPCSLKRNKLVTVLVVQYSLDYAHHESSVLLYFTALNYCTTTVHPHY